MMRIIDRSSEDNEGLWRKLLMKFQLLVLEGDRKAEKEKMEKHCPMHTKDDYLHRKQMENRPPLHNRSFYLCRMIEEELKGIDIDGSGRITICAYQVPGKKKYICDHYFNISVYYLEQEEINAIEKADKNTEPMIILGILRNSLLDIAQRNHCHEDVTKKLKGAFENIINNQFVREERISKLTRRNKNIGLTAHVYRILSDETGEGWYLKIVDRNGNIYCQAVISEDVRYVDRLVSRLYAKAEWHGNTFVILNRFGKETFSINVKTKENDV